MPAPALFGLRTASGLAVGAGLTMSMAFAPVAFGPYAIASVALLTAALWRSSLRRGLGLGYLAGAVFFGILLFWMHVVGWDAWLMLSLFWALWLALVGVGTSLATRLPGAPIWVATIWVLSEALRGRMPFGGFPWGNIAFAQPDTVLAGWASVGGTPLVTFAVALVGASIVTIALDFRAGRQRVAAGWFALAAIAVLVPGLIPAPASGDEVGGPPTAVVAVVQGGTPQVGLGAMDVRRAVLDNHVAQTLDLAASIAAGTTPQPAFVLWPENSSDIDPFTDPSVADAITAAARAVGVPILVGAVVTAPEDPNGVWNVGIVWDPASGPQQMYVKTHPVPFGEYIPFRDFLAQHIGRFDRIPRDFLAGTEPGNLMIGSVPVGNVICFEIAYGDVVDAVVEDDARLLTVQTNNATYGGTAQPEQQLAIARMRASEFGRSVVVAATSGVSAIISPNRTVTQSLDESEVGWLVAEVPLRGEQTLASSLGHPVELTLCAAAIASMIAAAVWSLVRRRRGIT
jgi:apolipoprotein N-acyltransferase